VTNPTDNCPDEPNFDQKDSDGDDLGDACELPPLIRRIRSITPECPTDELRRALDGDDDAYPAVNALIGPIGTKDAAGKAQAVLDVLRRTKRTAGSGGQRQVIGVMVSFDVELNGAPGNQGRRAVVAIPDQRARPGALSMADPTSCQRNRGAG
jgi:hypothetical protein